MVEKYDVFECGRKTSVYSSYAAVAMVTFSVTQQVAFKSEINIVVKFLCAIFCKFMCL